MSTKHRRDASAGPCLHGGIGLKGKKSTFDPRKIGTVLGLLLLAVVSGCSGPASYQQLRMEGQQEVLNGSYSVGRNFFDQCEHKRPRRDADNLHDLGACSVMVSKQKFAERNYAAAMRELDAATAYYTWAVDTNPGHQASIEGKSIALELKGQYDAALKNAEWAAEFVGPSARQYIWLGREMEKRRDLEGAMLRYRQAIAMEPKNAVAYATMADFLLRVDNKDAAIEYLESAYQLNPKDQWVADKLTQLGQTSRMVNRPAQGQTYGSP